LFDGRAIPGRSLPWYYLPKTLFLTTPSLFCGLFLVGAIGSVILYRTFTTRQKATILLVGWQILFLPLLAIARNSTLYDGMRHFLFIVPPLAALAVIASGWIYRVLRGKTLKIAVTVLFVMCLVPIAVDMVQLHPYQYLYYNRLSGGLASANGRYETDYWGLSVREAIGWLNENAPTGSKIVVTGPLFAAEIFADPRKAFRIVHLDDFEEGVEPNPDFYLGLHRSGYPALFAECSLVREVKRQGVPLTTIKVCPRR
jgi:hypothetical protein